MTHPVEKDGVLYSELRLAKYECNGYRKNGWKGKGQLGILGAERHDRHS